MKNALLIAILLFPCLANAQTSLVVSTDTELCGSSSFSTLTVEPGATLTLGSRCDTHVTMAGNLEVRGVFRSRPAPGVSHRITFAGVEEAAFVGGGMDPLASDVGLWVTGSGQLDIHGEPVEAWTRYPEHTGWDVGNEVIAVPVQPGDWSGFEPWDWTAAPVGPAGPGEVFNLSRSVIIEGEPGGRAHISIRSTRPQFLEYAEIRYMGPRQQVPGKSYTAGVLGRYPVHFHRCGDGSRGSIVRGVAVHRSGNRAVVPHASHGITATQVVAYDIGGDAVWYNSGYENAPDDLLLDRVLIAKVWDEPSYRGYRLAAFRLGHGAGNEIRDSVAVGVQGNKNASGFNWPGDGPADDSWTFEVGNVAHNNKINGLFVWQNIGSVHVVEGFLAYGNQFGIEHGAYVNRYQYKNALLLANDVGIKHHTSGHSDGMSYKGVVIEDSQNADIWVRRHSLPGDAPVLFEDCGDLSSVVLDDVGNHPFVADFRNCGLDVTEIDTTNAEPGFVLRVQDGGVAYQLDQNGVSPIAPF